MVITALSEISAGSVCWKTSTWPMHLAGSGGHDSWLHPEAVSLKCPSRSCSFCPNTKVTFMIPVLYWFTTPLLNLYQPAQIQGEGVVDPTSQWEQCQKFWDHVFKLPKSTLWSWIIYISPTCKVPLFSQESTEVSWPTKISYYYSIRVQGWILPSKLGP